jgi:UDP-glucose 4-epimerase
MRVLVTGVAGFIGSHVAEHCLKLGFDVVGVDDLSGGFAENIPKGVKFRCGSVTHDAWVAKLWDGGDFDYVYHLAAYAAEGLSHFIRRFNYQNNLIGSINLINQAVLHKVKCFVFTSSSAVYGTNQTPMTEDLVPRPEDPYGISKYAVELDLEAAYRMFGLPYIIFRPHNVYGERQNIADKYRNVVGVFMYQIMQNLPMAIFGDGLQTRAFSYIDDVAPLIAKAPLVDNAYTQVFNIGADKPCTVHSLAQKIAEEFGVALRIQYLPTRKEVLHVFTSHDKIRKFFNLSASVSLEEGIHKMAEWVRGLQTVAPPILFKNIEVPINLPPSWLV